MKQFIPLIVLAASVASCKNDPDPIQFTGTVLQFGSEPVPDALVEIKLTHHDSRQPIKDIYSGTTDQNGRYAITVKGIDQNDYRYVAVVSKTGLAQSSEPSWRPAVQSLGIYLNMDPANYLRIDFTLQGFQPDRNGVKDSLGITWQLEKADGSPIYPDPHIRYYTGPYATGTILVPYSRREARQARVFLYKAALPGIPQQITTVTLSQSDTTRVSFQQ